MPRPADLESLIEAIRQSRKYRALNLPVETLRDLFNQELARGRSLKQADDEVRKKLHNIVAPYLGDPDFDAAAAMLDDAFAAGSVEAQRAACAQILAEHASTRERQPILEEFYPRLWAQTGQPRIIVDLACALHPFSFPWMGLPTGVQYHAYDLNQPRVALINHYFRLQGLAELAETRDILVNPPEFDADVALFFKEAHRFEQRQHGCNRPFWLSVRARWLLVSLPTHDLAGHHSLIERQRALVSATLQGLSWPVEELLFENEIVFAVKKG